MVVYFDKDEPANIPRILKRYGGLNMRIWQRMKTTSLTMLLAALLLAMSTVAAFAASYPFTGVISSSALIPKAL